MAVQVQIAWRGYRGPDGRFAAQAPDRLAVTLHAIAEGLLARARHEAPQRRPADTPPGLRPGGLRRGLRVAVRRPRGLGHPEGALELSSAAPYTRYVRQGRGPIVARAGRRLRFFAGGRWVYAQRVRGVPPNDFVARALAAYRPQLRVELGRLVGRIRDAFLGR